MIWIVWIFLFDIPLCTFNQNAWICSYKRLDGLNYYPLNGLKQLLRESFTNKFHQYWCWFASAFHFPCFLLINHHRKVCFMKGAGHWSQFKTAIFLKPYQLVVKAIFCTFIFFKAHCCLPLAARRLRTGYSTKGADHCSFGRTVWNSYFEKV